jgi:hypothetical protein
MKRYTTILLLVFLAVWSHQQVVAQPAGPATYTVTFDAFWSAVTHPDDFPPNPHFSPLVGATHNTDVVFWEPGELASEGIESMAETGGTEILRSEIDAAGPSVGSTLLDSGLNPSPGTLSFSFEITPDYPLVTLVTMVAPSPDWFVGVAGLNLLDNGQWQDRVEVELFVYDAGTDSGPSYTSENADTDPADPIARIEAAPFVVSGSVASVGTFTFVRETATSVENPAEVPGTHLLSAAYPNPFNPQTTFTLAVSQRQQVRLAVYNLLGQHVATLHNGLLAAGTPHRFTIDGSDLPGGVYLYRAEGEHFCETRRVVLVK